jgi:PAS domain S-box-containing protein
MANPDAPEVAFRAGDRLLDSLGEGLFVVDPTWRLTYVNVAAERSTGLTRDQLVGRSLWEVFPTLTGSRIGDACRRAMDQRIASSVRSVAVARVPGGPVAGTFDVRCNPVEDEGILVLFREVTAREQARRALAAQSAENLRLRELARTMAAESDAGALLDALCRAAADLCGAVGATVAEVEDDRARFVASHGHPPFVLGHRFPVAGTLTGRVRDAQRRGEEQALRVEAGEARDAAFCPFLSDGRQVGAILLAPLAAHGELLGVLAVSRPAGERPFDTADEARLRVVADHAALALWKAQLVQEAQAASLAKSSFLASVSHELRTPLTALTGYGELLADEIVGPLVADQREIVERMRTVTHQLTAMIEEILTYSSLEAGREVARARPVDLDDVLHAVRSVVEPLAATKGLAFAMQVAPDVPPLVTDPDKLRQVLINLCGNGVKFTARGAVGLAVSAVADADAGPWVRFAVTDTGAGIDAADFDRLFLPFSQLDDGLTRRHGGTGLGLYISQRLARLLGGRVEVTSTPAVGSVFTLAIPAAVAAVEDGF